MFSGQVISLEDSPLSNYNKNIKRRMLTKSWALWVIKFSISFVYMLILYIYIYISIHNNLVLKEFWVLWKLLIGVLERKKSFTIFIYYLLRFSYLLFSPIKLEILMSSCPKSNSVNWKGKLTHPSAPLVDWCSFTKRLSTIHSLFVQDGTIYFIW